MKKIDSKQFQISLRFFVTATVSVLVLFVVLAYSVVSASLYEEQKKNSIDDYMDRECSYITELLTELRMISTDNLSDEEKVQARKVCVSRIEGAVEAAARPYEGRCSVIDAHYKIAYDSVESNVGKYIVDKDIFALAKSTDVDQTIDTAENAEKIYVADVDGKTYYIVIRIPYNTAGFDPITGWKKHLGYAALILALGVATAFIIGRVCIQGIRYLSAKMDDMGTHLDEKIPEKGFKEFRNMTEKYNDTIERLSKAEVSRNEFVSNVSHELKTPITSMKVLADSLVQNEEATLPMYQEFMKDIVIEIDRETEIINDLLTLVRTDKQSGSIKLAETNINKLVDVIVKRVTPIAEARDIKISTSYYKEVSCNVDEAKLIQAFSNIIENAVKYNVDGGSVSISLNSDNKYFHLKVADTGVGIPDDCKDKVFDRFYRVDKARSRDTGGTGLGLAITKNIIKLHKGSVKLYSEAGEGTTFTIKIPLGLVEDADKKEK